LPARRLTVSEALDRAAAALAGADAEDLLHRRDEHLAVADHARPRGALDRLDDGGDAILGDDDLEL
jgi:hypothetical protein